MNRDPKPLYRKVNTRARGAHWWHGDTGKSKWERNTKAAKADERMRGTMHSGQTNGRDYTPLYRYLLSRLGDDWHEISRDAIRRLDNPERLYDIVYRKEETPKYATARTGETSFFNTLVIDDANRLAVFDPDMTPEVMMPYCACCTTTLNGVRVTRRYEPQ